LLGMDGILGLGGWQWMFIIEGLPACILGLFCLWFLADRPEQASWLTDAERNALVRELASDKTEKPKKDLWAAMKDVRVLMLTAITFAFTILLWRRNLAAADPQESRPHDDADRLGRGTAVPVCDWRHADVGTPHR